MRALALVTSLVLSAPLASCYSPRLTDGQFTCKQGGCPSGLTCECGLCREPGADLGQCTLTDGGAGDLASDLSAVDAGPLVSPCTNGNKLRAIGDPGHPDVALCPAAWTKKGITDTTTPCNRAPGNLGTSGATACTAEDNCTAGWHICDSETELKDRGFTQADCTNVGSGGGGGGAMFATRASGAPSSMGGMPGAPTCLTSEKHIVMGCGTLGASALGDCTIVTHGLVSPPGSDQCASDTGGTWSCSTTAGNFEAAVVIKTALDKGGVICCRN